MRLCGKTVAGSIQGICDAITAYYSPAPKIETLYIIYKETADWKKKNVSALFATSSERTKESAVNLLQISVIEELNGLVGGLGDALAGYQHKRATSGTLGGGFTKLGAGYSHERSSYVAGGKNQAPLSGSRVHDVVEGEKEAGNNINFANLSAKEFEHLGTNPDLLKAHLRNRTVVRMYFLNKIQRLKLLASCDRSNPAGPRWLNISGQAMHSPIQANDFLAEENTLQMWAMDRYGNLFVDFTSAGYGRHVMGIDKNSAAAAINARGVTNHSSFCAGREVICAGNIFFWKGQLLHIDNQSGHYAPSRQALFNAVSILWNEGAVLDYLRVGVASKNALAFHRGNTFLQHGRADWPDQNPKSDQNAIYQACNGFQM
jgi:hypothetical protein